MTSDLPSKRLIPILVLILTGAIDVVAQNTAERRSKEDVVQLAALIVSAEGTPAADNNLADAYKDERTLKAEAPPSARSSAPAVPGSPALATRSEFHRWRSL